MGSAFAAPVTGLKWNLKLSWAGEATKSNWTFLLLELFLLLGFGKRNYFKEKCIFNFIEEQNSENRSIGSLAFSHCKCCKRVKGSAESHLITPLGVRLPRRCHFQRHAVVLGSQHHLPWHGDHSVCRSVPDLSSKDCFHGVRNVSFSLWVKMRYFL